MSNLHMCALRSGSRGNSTLVFSNSVKILVDCGISCKMAVSALFDIGISPEEIDAIFVTHEHSDHIKGISVFSKKFGVPVYANSATWSYLRPILSGVAEENVKIIEEENILIGDINVCAFATSHDAVCPVGYTFVSGGEKASVATDMGVVSERVLNELRGSDKILLEANHDLSLLSIGPYPEPLKRRIKSDRGHLCNEAAKDVALSLLESGTKHFILGHMSQENNNPDLAYLTVSQPLAETGREFYLTLSYPDKTSAVI